MHSKRMIVSVGFALVMGIVSAMAETEKINPSEVATPVLKVYGTTLGSTFTGPVTFSGAVTNSAATRYSAAITIANSITLTSTGVAAAVISGPNVGNTWPTNTSTNAVIYFIIKAANGSSYYVPGLMVTP